MTLSHIRFVYQLPNPHEAEKRATKIAMLATLALVTLLSGVIALNSHV